MDVALLLLRVFVGIAFVLHGWGKIRDVGGFSARHGVPIFLGAAAVQCIGGLLLVVRLLTPQAALGIGVTMVVTIVILVRAGEPFINPIFPTLSRRRGKEEFVKGVKNGA